MQDRGQWFGEDASRREAFQRALDVSGAGSVLLQTFINRTVQSLVIREHGVQAVLERKPGSGDAAYINRRAPGSTPGEWVNDTDSLTQDSGDYTQKSFTYRTLATQGKVTRKLQATGRSYADVLADEITMKVEDFADVLEEGLIQGDSNANSKQIDGLLTLVNAVSGQVIANTTAAAGDDLVLAHLDEAIDEVKGSANAEDVVIIGSKKGSRQLNAALQAQQQFTNMTEVAAGFRVRTYDGYPIVKSTKMPDTLTWNGSGASITKFTGGSTTALAVVNRRYNWIEELTPTTVMPLARDSSQHEKFDIFADLAFVHANTQGASLLGGIKA